MTRKVYGSGVHLPHGGGLVGLGVGEGGEVGVGDGAGEGAGGSVEGGVLGGLEGANGLGTGHSQAAKITAMKINATHSGRFPFFPE